MSLPLGLGLGLGIGTQAASSEEAWSPADASVPLLAWFKADAGVTQAGGLVSAWADQSGSGDANRNQSAAGADRPSYSASDAGYGGKPVLTGNGSQFLASAGDWSTAPTPPITVIVVGHATANSSFVGDPANNNMLYVSGGHEATYGINNGALVGSGDASAPTVIMYTDTGAAGGSAANIYNRDLSTPTGTDIKRWEGVARLDMLADFAGAFTPLIGAVAEIIVLGGIPNATDLTNLKTYLNTTRAYGLAVT